MIKPKNLILTSIIYAIVIGVYNLLVFVIFKEFSSVFWMSYAFSMLAFGVQYTSMLLSFRKSDVETVFFGLPLASFSVFYLIAQICVGFIFMIFQKIGTTIPLVIQVLVLAIFAVIAIIAIMARDTVQEIGETIKTKIVEHKSKNVDVDVLLATCEDAALKSKLRKISETIKYADPMTTDVIADVEQRIGQKLSELRIYCENGETDEAVKTCSALELLYVERNKKLILSK